MAGTLTGFGDDSKPGTIRGFTEAAWLFNQLRTLFDLRNKLIDAQEVVERHRIRMQKLLDQAEST